MSDFLSIDAYESDMKSFDMQLVEMKMCIRDSSCTDYNGNFMLTCKLKKGSQQGRMGKINDDITGFLTISRVCINWEGTIMFSNSKTCDDFTIFPLGDTFPYGFPHMSGTTG